MFDSGVGGLSVLRAIRHALPAEDLLYAADSGFAPYGSQSVRLVRQRAEAIAEFFVAAGTKAIVVACNTASAVAVQALRSRFAVPIIAMEPAIKPAAQMTRSGVIGVLATGHTLASEAFSRLLERYGKGVKVFLQACPDLVEQVEKGDLDGRETRAAVARYVRPLVDAGADTIVLGCTHFPFLRAAIEAAAGSGVSLLDPAVAVARELERRLKNSGALCAGEAPGSDRFLTSGASDKVKAVIRQLWGARIEVDPLPAPLCAP